ncbi:MAG: S49 family peptidase [Candidatus Dormibacteraceae bacterium]
MLLFPFRYLWWLLSSVRRSIGRPPDFVEFTLEEELPALPDPPPPLWRRFISPPRLSKHELAERFEAIGRDSRIQGVVLHLRPVETSMASVEDLRELVANLRRAGKRVVAWAPFYTTGTYYLACACDEILLMPVGSVQPMGVARTGMFLADGLARVGIKADFVQISPYKTAADQLTRSTMSEQYREQVTWLLESQYAELVKAIAESRRVDENAAKAIIDSSPYGDDTVVDRHVVDRIVPEEQLADHLSGGAATPLTVGTWDRARRKMRRPAPSLGRGRYVAVIRIEGTIVDGRSGSLPVRPPVEIPVLGDQRAGDLSVVQVARQVAGDKRAAAAVLYVNSRGGSATASEAMRQALNVVAARKPMVVVMGPVAGSGGYWVAMPGSWIIARPSTLTGSIGVLTGKVVTSALWAKLLLNRETVAFGENVELESDEAPYSTAQRTLIRGEVDRIYGLFVDVVARARKMSVDEVQPIASGRVWTGRQALERKLIDELGGLAAGVRKARALAGLPDSAPVRESRVPKRTIAPPARAAAGAGAWLGYLLEGMALINRAPALAVMEYLPGSLI